MRTAERYLGSAVLLVALGLAPALGYATTFVLLGLGAVAAVWLLWQGPLTRRFAATSPPKGEVNGGTISPHHHLSPEGEVSVGHDPAHASPLPGGRGRREAAGEGAFAMLQAFALLGAFIGLATALLYRYGLGMPRAAEGFWLTDPYRLAITTLIAATLSLGAWFAPSRLRWPSLLALAAAVAVIGLTGSRTALLGLPVMLLITGLCLARRPTARAAIIVASVVIVIAALFVELPGTERLRLWDVLAAIASGGPVADAAIDIRIGLANAATQLFASAPIFGHGWSESTMSAVTALLTPDQLRWGRIPHLHSDLGQFAVSGGVFGLVAYTLLLLAPIAGYLRLPREFRTAQRLHALLVLVIGAIVLGLPDTFLAAPMTLTIYVVLAAAITGRR